MQLRNSKKGESLFSSSTLFFDSQTNSDVIMCEVRCKENAHF